MRGRSAHSVRLLAGVSFFAISALGAASASGQSIVESGEVSPTVAGSGASVGNLTIGTNAAGSVDVSGGAVLDATKIDLGINAAGNGFLTVTGAGSQANSVNSMLVGQNGSGSLIVGPGGVIRTTSALDGGADIVLGANVGSSGTATVNAGGTLQAADSLLVGFSGTGLLTINTGGSVVQEGLANGSTALGFSTGSSGTINVAGGTLSVTRPETGPTPERHSIMFVGYNGSGTLNVSDGGAATVGTASSGTQPGSTFGSGIQIGGDTSGTTSGVGSVTVSGAGSTLETLGVGSFINVGRFNSSNPFNLNTLAVSNGGTVATSGLGIGRDGANGLLSVDGLGSSLVLSGVRQDGSGALAIIGRGAAAGTLTLSNGGSATVDGTGATAVGPGGILVGNDAASVGTVNLETGANLSILSDRAGVGMTVGRLGSGTLNVTGGSTLTINDNSATGAGGLAFGGNGTVATGGAFAGTISGPGTSVSITGTDVVLVVGRNSGSSGTVNVSAGASVAADAVIVGSAIGSSGTLNVSGSGTTVSLVGETAGTTGAGLSVGRGGNGTMTVSGGALIAIDGSAVAAAVNPLQNNVGLNIGGSQTQAGGTGTLTVTGANSRITVLGNAANGNASQATIGRDISGTTATTGTVLVEAGGKILFDADGRVSVGHSGLGNGTLTVTGGGSQFVAGAFLGVGVNNDGGTVNAGGTGTLNVTSGGLAQAGTIHVGASGTLNENSGTVKGGLVVAGTATFANSLGIGTTTGNLQGTLTILSGGSVTQEGLANGTTGIGAAPGDTGTVNVQGGTFNARTATTGQAFIGVGGGNNTGTLTVTDGGKVTIGTATSGTLAGNAFGAGMNVAGSSNGSSGTGTVLVSGAGSRIDILGDGSYISVGRFGSTSTGAMTVADGGEVSATTLSIGRANGTGVSGSIGTVIVDGAGSRITLDRKGSPSGTPVFYAPGGTIGQDGGTGTLTIRNGGNVTLDASASPATGGGFMVGAIGGSGSLNVQSGGTLNITGAAGGAGGITVGATGGSGVINVDGPGTAVTIAGVSTAAGSPGLTAGRETGSTGTINITSGASVGITVASGTGGGLTLARDAGSTGTLNVDAASMTFNGAGGGTLSVGRLGSGTLNVTNGGTLTFDGGSGVAQGMTLGGDGASGTGGTFNVTLSGAGSAINVNGIDAGLSIGRAAGSSGTFTVSGGAALNADVFAVARATGSSGNMIVTGAGTTVSLTGDAAGTLGAGFAVGAGGTGMMTIGAGAQVSINGGGDGQAALTVGGSRTVEQGGTGTLTVTGAGTIVTMSGTDIRMQVGFENTAISGGGKAATGTISITDGAQVILAPGGKVAVGATAGSTGTLNVTGTNSFLNAGAFLGVGQDANDGPGGNGHLNVTDGGTVQATVIHIGQTGLVTGTGTIIGTVYNDGIINPGNSPGVLKILGKLETGENGKIVLEVAGNEIDGYVLDSIVFEGPDAAANAALMQLNKIEFAFIDGTDANAVLTSIPELLDLDNFFKVEVDGTEKALSEALSDGALAAIFTDVEFGGSTGEGTQSVIFQSFDPFDPAQLAFTIVDNPSDVPEPATMVLLGAGLGGLIWARRRRAAA